MSKIQKKERKKEAEKLIIYSPWKVWKGLRLVGRIWGPSFEYRDAVVVFEYDQQVFYFVKM